MLENLNNFYESVSGFDLAYIIITILSLIKCYRKGFVLSLLAASKWLLAYIVTLVLFPRAKPYVDGIIDNEYILDIMLGVGIFVIVILHTNNTRRIQMSKWSCRQITLLLSVN